MYIYIELIFAFRKEHSRWYRRRDWVRRYMYAIKKNFSSPHVKKRHKKNVTYFYCCENTDFVEKS